MNWIGLIALQHVTWSLKISSGRVGDVLYNLKPSVHTGTPVQPSAKVSSISWSWNRLSFGV